MALFATRMIFSLSECICRWSLRGDGDGEDDDDNRKKECANEWINEWINDITKYAIDSKGIAILE